MGQTDARPAVSPRDASCGRGSERRDLGLLFNQVFVFLRCVCAHGAREHIQGVRLKPQVGRVPSTGPATRLCGRRGLGADGGSGPPSLGPGGEAACTGPVRSTPRPLVGPWEVAPIRAAARACGSPGQPPHPDPPPRGFWGLTWPLWPGTGTASAPAVSLPPSTPRGPSRPSASDEMHLAPFTARGETRAQHGRRRHHVLLEPRPPGRLLPHGDARSSRPQATREGGAPHRAGPCSWPAGAVCRESVMDGDTCTGSSVWAEARGVARVPPMCRGRRPARGRDKASCAERP